MNFKWLKVFLLCLISAVCLAGCGTKSELKDELSEVELTFELPEVVDNDYMYLRQADEEVYLQQLAACDMYYEAYYRTRTSDFSKKYKNEVKSKRISYYCNERRKELTDDISQELRDNVRKIIEDVEDCENPEAYLDRVVYDVVNFYDYYADFSYAETDEEFEENACRILKVFYERRNILAFSFMKENKDVFIDTATMRIVKNSSARDTYSMYITENNELIKALNAVYDGVSSERADVITKATIKLVRKMLEDDNELDEKSIDTLMRQLGEPTPEPTVEPTPEPDVTPIPTPQSVRPTQQPQPKPTQESYVIEIG